MRNTFAPREKPNPLLAEMDKMAHRLLVQAQDPATGDLTTSLAIFQGITRWVAVRNKIDDGGVGGYAGSSLDDFKKQLERAKATERTSSQPEPEPEPIDDEFAAYLRREGIVPEGDGGSAGSNGSGGASEISIAAGGGRSVRVDLSGAAEPDDDDGGNDRDL